jgi:hypothetical protein
MSTSETSRGDRLRWGSAVAPRSGVAGRDGRTSAGPRRSREHHRVQIVVRDCSAWRSVNHQTAAAGPWGLADGIKSKETEPVARSTSRPSRASIVTDRLCGSIPITIRSTSRPPRLSSIPYWRGRATLFRAEQTLLEPRLTAAPGRPHAMKEPHPTRGGQPREERTYPVPTRD